MGAAPFSTKPSKPVVKTSSVLMMDPWVNARDILLYTKAKLKSEVEIAFGVTTKDPSIKPPPAELKDSVITQQPTRVLFHIRSRELGIPMSIQAKERIAVSIQDNLKTEWDKPFSVSEQEVDTVLHCTQQLGENCWYKVNNAQCLVNKVSAL